MLQQSTSTEPDTNKNIRRFDAHIYRYSNNANTEKATRPDLTEKQRFDPFKHERCRSPLNLSKDYFSLNGTES